MSQSTNKCRESKHKHLLLFKLNTIQRLKIKGSNKQHIIPKTCYNSSTDNIMCNFKSFEALEQVSFLFHNIYY